MTLSTAALPFTFVLSFLGVSAIDAAAATPVAGAQLIGTGADASAAVVQARAMRHRTMRAHEESHLGRRHCRKFSSRCTSKGAMTP